MEKEKNRHSDEPVSTDTAETKDKNKNTEQTEIDTLKQSLQTCEKAQKDWKDKFISVSADLENFRRRVEKDQAMWAFSAQAKIVQDILPIIDDFERALEKKEDASKEVENWLQGVTMISDALNKLLKKYDVTEIDCTILFDPLYHEALMQVDSPDHESGQIVSVMQKGYLLKDKVLRPAKVSVAK